MSEQNDQPIAWVVPVQQMEGRVAKRWTVPAGWIGIQVHPNGRVQWYDPGRHALVTAAARMSGQAVGLQAGLLPDRPVLAAIQAGPLLSQDQELLYASLVFQAKLSDPELFFRKLVLPRRSVGEPVDATNELTVRALENFTAQFPADNLAHGSLSTLVETLTKTLEPALGSVGMDRIQLTLLAFQSPAERAAALALAQQPGDPTDLSAYEAAGLRVISAELLALGSAPAQDCPVQAEHARAFQAWRELVAQRGRVGGQRRRLEETFRKQRRGGETATPVNRRWWLPYALRAAAFLVGGALLARLALFLAGSLNWNSGWLIAAGVGSLALLLILHTLRAWVLQRETRAEAAWPTVPASEVDGLIGPARHRVDSLLRDRCASELAEAANSIKDIRHGLYLQGNEELAQRATRLRTRLEQAIDNVRNPGYAQPPYLSDFKVPPEYWQDLLDVEEQVLAHAEAIGANLQAMQETFRRSLPIDELLDRFEARLEAYNRQFARRSRFLNDQEGELEGYQR